MNDGYDDDGTNISNWLNCHCEDCDWEGTDAQAVDPDDQDDEDEAEDSGEQPELRVCILDHKRHEAYIEDIPCDVLHDYYNDSIPAYIEDNYNVEKGGYSYEGVCCLTYYHDGDAVNVEMPKL